MKKLDNGKTSLVEFLASIKFARANQSGASLECNTPFAGFNQRARTNRQYSVEDSQLIRSAN